jgi:8-oxo-dGTP pyrophosphatase MutT (NUDIX family)
MNIRQPSPAQADAPQAAATQVAALCWRIENGVTEVLLITSRETGRWVIPKGWPMTGLSDAEAATREAWEEAGVQGRVAEEPLGRFVYDKALGGDRTRRCAVAVYPLEVERLKSRFPEAEERRRRWCSADEAAALVAEPQLKTLLSEIAADAERLLRPMA